MDSPREGPERAAQAPMQTFNGLCCHDNNHRANMLNCQHPNGDICLISRTQATHTLMRKHK